MDRVIIRPAGLPPPRGFSHGILVRGGAVLFLAGQDASGPDGRIAAPGDLLAQFEQVLRNLQAVVRAAGGQLRDIVKLNIFVRDRKGYLAQLGPIGEIFRRHFEGHYPAMALFEVSGFFRDDALVEVEGIAVIDELEARAE
jgi:enamine deaminase RidA (YjgF/YER057c/UK114 family)